MVTLLKILVIIAVLLLMVFPLFMTARKGKKAKTRFALRYEHPDNRKNFIFILLAIFEIVILAIAISLLSRFGDFITSLPLLDKLFAAVSNNLPNQVKYIITVAVMVVIVNLIAMYGYLVMKTFLKKFVMEHALLSEEEKAQKREEKRKRKLEKQKKRREKKNKNEKDGKTPAEEEKKKDPTPDPKPSDDTIPSFPHTDKKKKQKDADDRDLLEGLIDYAEGDEEALKPEKNRFLSLFFEGDYYEFARHWVHRVIAILRLFLLFTKTLYIVFFFTLLLAVFFPLPEAFYGVLDTLTRNLYIYPFISIILLQEVVNTFSAPVKEAAYAKEAEKKKKKEEEEGKEPDLDSLKHEILSSYGDEHCIRFFPAGAPNPVSEYVVTNKTYASAIRYISNEMERVSGHVVQRYLEGVDALFNNTHISFAASFYSELGEYLIAYTYIRLLAGERQLFVVSDRSRVKPLKRYIRDRLTKMTGCTEKATWHILSAEEEIKTADVLIVCPDDFKSDNMVQKCPSFFEEICNAIFVDADRILTLDSYLCPIMSLRLQQATGGRVRFVFLSYNILHGFANSLRKFFCIDEVLDYSSLDENERVDCYLWNRESKRIYRGREQRTTAIESKIAALAADYGVDGVRILTESPFDNVEKQELIDHRVEFNEFHKNVPDVNYLITTDERYNLASAIYGFTRFRGKKESILHVVSKPYLLREYFMAHIERYVNRSSFIQPRVTEHAQERKISLLRVFCEATDSDGMSEDRFCSHMEAILRAAETCFSLPLSPFCEKLEKEFSENGSLTTLQYAAYVIAGLFDEEDTPIEQSEGQSIRDYFVYTNEENRGKSIKNEIIRVRFSKESAVFDRILSCNRRVELRLHDSTVGTLDTFPTRVAQQYQKGQTILYNNRVYEIESIAPDGKIIYLRQESITDVKYLDTVPIRRYLVKGYEKVGDQPHRITFTRGVVDSIELWRMRADLECETYAYHWLVTDRQVLDFVKGVSGDKLISADMIEKQKRSYRKSPLLSLSIKTNSSVSESGVCNDGMRLLMAAVFNEFIRTIFPDAYRCIVACPVLKDPLNYPMGSDIVTYNDHVKTVYPYLKGESEFVTEDNEIRLLLLNDCSEDIGVLDLLYNSAASLIQEFLTNIYGYLYWLKENPTLASGQKHYIYFGADKMPEVYDLDGCCHLLKDFNKIFSDGKTDRMTIIEEDEVKDEAHCAFCYEPLESGRFFKFREDSRRPMCTDCYAKSVGQEDTLTRVFDVTARYFEKNFPEEALPQVTVSFDTHYPKEPPFLNEYSYHIDESAKTILVERDIPQDNAAAAILRGLLEFCHIESKLECSATRAQLYYEELVYLLSVDKNPKAPQKSPLSPEKTKAAELYLLLAPETMPKGLIAIDPSWFKPDGDEDGKSSDGRGARMAAGILKLLERDMTEKLCEICEYILTDGCSDKRTSFTFLREELEKFKKPIDDDFDGKKNEDDVTDPEDTENEELYDPDDIPRFWRRYLVNEKATGSEDVIPGDGEDRKGTKDHDTPNGETDETDPADDLDPTDPTEPSDENLTPEERKKAEKERKKAEKEEAKRKKQEEKDKKSAEDGKKKEEEAARKKQNPLYQKIKSGIELCPYDEREKTNKYLALYCAIVRHAADFDTSKIDVPHLTPKETHRIYELVCQDYPEFFWMRTYQYTYRGEDVFAMQLSFRFTDEKGNLNAREIREKRKAIRSAAKFYTAGITRATDRYEAALTIYRRLILNFDYDGVGLNARVDRDDTREDTLRSLHAALVGKKVVCAGYAVAMQYLLQTVGIPCATVVSERDSKGIAHAFNLMKIGKKCYYIDSTWGDSSNTQTGDENANTVKYDYFCVPLRELKLARTRDYILNHTPRLEYYPFLEEMNFTDLEYHRAHGYYIQHYDEKAIKDVIEKTVRRYDRKEMGDFAIHLRCPVSELKDVEMRLLRANGISTILESLRTSLPKKYAKLLEGKAYLSSNEATGTIRIFFQ